MAKRRAEAAQEGEEKPFGGSAVIGGPEIKNTGDYDDEGIQRLRGQPH